MKKHLLLAMSLLSLAFFGNAQNYFVDGTTWTMDVTPNNPMDANWKETVSLVKDSTADGQVYLMIGNSTWGNEDNRQIAKIKTEGEKVFFSLIEKPELGWFLLYDFGLKLNDRCTVYSPDLLDTDGYPLGCELQCTEIIENNVEFDGFTTMGMKHSSENDETSTIWIKGIGDTWGVLTNFSFGLDGGTNPRLVEVKNGDEIIYSQNKSNVIEEIFSDEIEFYVTGNKLTIKTNSSSVPCYIYRTDGLLISQLRISKDHQSINLPEKGCYILKIGDRQHKIYIR